MFFKTDADYFIFIRQDSLVYMCYYYHHRMFDLHSTASRYTLHRVSTNLEYLFWDMSYP